MAGGRPTNDPKGTLIAARLSKRQLYTLQERARREGVTVSEALRRCLDDWDVWARQQPARTRSPTPEERESLHQAFAALGLGPRRSKKR